MARPEWIAYSNEEIEEFIVKFKREGTGSRINPIFVMSLQICLTFQLSLFQYLKGCLASNGHTKPQKYFWLQFSLEGMPVCSAPI